VLGICRGCQLINVAFGGTLHQHVPTHARFDDDPAAVAHDVVLQPGSALAAAHRASEGGVLAVNSLHHQAIDAVGSGLVVTGAAPDGTVEAIEHRHESILAVQWHPELLALPQPVFGWLLDEARRLA
jgi:putative glutamine amidotransferase